MEKDRRIEKERWKKILIPKINCPSSKYCGFCCWDCEFLDGCIKKWKKRKYDCQKGENPPRWCSRVLSKYEQVWNKAEGGR